MLVTLQDLLPQAARSDYAVPCFNVFGVEEVVAILTTAQALDCGVILACNKEMAELMGVAGFAGMVRGIAERTRVPVCVHLDHCYDETIIYAALRSGFTSVMFDGSQLPLQENIDRTARVAEVAHAFGASIEGEIGSVPYSEGRDHIKSELTDPQAAADFAQYSGVDGMAIAVGNVHRLTTASSEIDFARIARIEALSTVPLVIHGTSGIRPEDLAVLRKTRVSKFNVGTTMRQTFSRSLRASLEANPTLFDRLTLMKPVVAALEIEACRVFELLGNAKRTSVKPAQEVHA
jgi:fructose-bisphosphate aldolase class II